MNKLNGQKDTFKVYGASAGSGKTFTLVKSYLILLLSSNNPEYFKHILAITFTNKATAEMKNRIMEALNDFAHRSDLSKKHNDALFQVVKEELKISAEEIEKRSSRIFTSLLHNYNDFSVSTIDKFNHRIIRTFAYDLHLPLNFEISLRQEEAISRAIDLTINKIGEKDKEAKQITRALIDFTSYKMQQNDNWKFEQDLNSLAVKLLNDSNLDLLKQLEQQTIEDKIYFLKKIKERKKTVENRFASAAELLLSIIYNEQLETKDFKGKTRGMYNWPKRIESGKLDLNKTLKDIIEDGNWLSKEGEEKVASTKLDNIKVEIKEIYEDYAYSKILKGLINNMSLLQLLSSIQQSLVQLKKDENILNISDFNKLISEIVVDEPLPFIYERLGEHYHHYMIDEFQDTSTIQWKNLTPLLENSLAYQNLNLIVGDPKQAIYRFRGGDVQQFVDLIQAGKGEIEVKDNNAETKYSPVLEEKIRQIKNLASYENLKNNYRSKKEIVSFNNHFFEFIKKQLESELIIDAYKDVKQEYSKANDGGDVQIKILPKPANKEEENKVNGDAVIKYIKQCMALGYRYKDIAILCRSKAEGAIIATQLEQFREDDFPEGIPVISNETLLLAGHQSIQLLIHALYFIKDDEEEETQAQFSIALIENKIIDEPIEAILNHIKTKKDYLRTQLSKLGLLKDIKNELELYGLVEKLADQFNLLETKADAYLQSFLEVVFQFTQDQNQDVSEFLNWWEEEKEKLSIKTSGNIDAIQILTIHKSKGLEFPVVIYPFANSEAKIQKKYALCDYPIEKGKEELALLNINTTLEDSIFENILQDEKEKALLDLINLVYVTFTRAKNRLFIISKEPPKTSSTERVNEFLKSFIKSNTLAIEEKEEFTFSYGNPQKKEEEKEEVVVKEKLLNQFIYDDWKEKIKVSYQWLDAWDEELKDVQSNRSQGKLIHTILSNIKYEKDVKPILERLYLKGIIQEEEISEIENRIGKMISQPENKVFFDSLLKVKNEASILAEDGKIFRPDRIITDATGNITIIDFKTGKKEEKHQHQINQYAALLKNMGKQEVQTKVIYL